MAAGGAVVAWLGYRELTADRPFDIVLAGFTAVVVTAVTAAVLWRLVSRSTSVR